MRSILLLITIPENVTFPGVLNPTRAAKVIALTAMDGAHTQPGEPGDHVSPGADASHDDQQTEYVYDADNDEGPGNKMAGILGEAAALSSAREVGRSRHEKEGEEELHPRPAQEETIQEHHSDAMIKLVDYDEDDEEEAEPVSEKLLKLDKQIPAMAEKQMSAAVEKEKEDEENDHGAEDTRAVETVGAEDGKEDDDATTGQQAAEAIRVEEGRNKTSIGGPRTSKRRGQWEDGQTRGPKKLKMKPDENVTVKKPRIKSKRQRKKQEKTLTIVSQGASLSYAHSQDDEVQEWPGPLPTEMDADSKEWYFTEAIITLDINETPQKIEEKEGWLMADAMGNWHTYRPAVHVCISLAQIGFLI